MEFSDKLHKYIKINSFCLVGNSPIEIGKFLGKNIDSYETVIRFNDYSLNFAEDYGNKTDIWVRATNDQVIETLKDKLSYSHKIVFFRSDNLKNIKSREVLLNNNSKFLILPIHYEKKLSKELGAIPSLGLLMMYILKHNNFKITKNNAFGFSFFDNQDIKNFGNHHYYNIKTSTISKGELLARHNWSAEKKYFIKNIIGM